MAQKNIEEIIDKLSDEISYDVGNLPQDDLDVVDDLFNQSLSAAMSAFHSRSFNDDGFIRRLSNIELDQANEKDMMKNVLNGIRTDYIGADSLNQTEFLQRRDINNICTQMPEMRDAIMMLRDSIIECDVASGEVSRSLMFENQTDNDLNISQTKEIEEKFDTLMSIKNFIVPKSLTGGVSYVHVVPYSKLFAELKAIREKKYENKTMKYNGKTTSVKQENTNSIFSEKNLSLMMEAVSPYTESEYQDQYNIENNKDVDRKILSRSNERNNLSREGMSAILRSIEVKHDGSSPLLTEFGEAGFESFITEECFKDAIQFKQNESVFAEAMGFHNVQTSDTEFSAINPDDISDVDFKHIKGCYCRYLDPLRVVPIYMDRRVIGYYYVTTTMDLQANPANPSGIVDLSYQTYTKDRNIIDNLASIIIRSFDNKMLERNIKLKDEIAEIVMAHKFTEGRLTFIYIPENEIVSFPVNIDENGKGHSAIEPSLFQARLYTMLDMYNMLYILNNNTTRVHYVKSSGLNKDYSSQIQRTMRKYQSRRITIDDIYSYSGVLNKIGGMGEMVLPAGRADIKALETDTIEAVNNPINTEFIEQHRRQALAGSSTPNLMAINALNEVEFAKSMELANTRFLSTVSAYKIDFNRSITKWYQLLLTYCTDMEADVIRSFKFKFNAIKQAEVAITADMAQNFETTVQLAASVVYLKSDLEDDKGNPTEKAKIFRREMLKKYVPQLDIDIIYEIYKTVEEEATNTKLHENEKNIDIDDQDINDIKN